MDMNTTQQTSSNPVVAKVQRLLRLAYRNANANEGKAAAAQATKLMASNGLKAVDVEGWR